MSTTTMAADHLELQRCLHSLIGQLEAICEDMKSGPSAFVLRSIIEGGMPEILHVARRLGTKAGFELDDAVASKSFARGYQVAVLQAREEAGVPVTREQWREDPEEFMTRRLATEDGDDA